MPSHHTPLHVAAARAVGVDDLKVDAPPRADLGDLAVGCFTLAKAQGKKPAELAQQIAAAFTPNEWLASATAAGPFVNFRANRPAVYRWLVDVVLRGQLLPRTLGAGKTICIDYGSPNISKHLAYHHIRGTTIGHSLSRTFGALGYRVVDINFLGDWGTTHGMVLAAYHEAGTTAAHRDAVLSAREDQTVVTEAFSGRAARGIRNRYLDEFDAAAGLRPLSYPWQNALTRLKKSGARLIGVGWAIQRLTETIPGDAWDVPLDGFASPDGLELFSR